MELQGGSLSHTELRWLSRIIRKPLEAWRKGIETAHRNGYFVHEDWATPTIYGPYYQARLNCDFPDVRKTVVTLMTRNPPLVLYTETVENLEVAVRRAVELLNDAEVKKLRR